MMTSQHLFRNGGDGPDPEPVRSLCENVPPPSPLLLGELSPGNLVTSDSEISMSIMQEKIPLLDSFIYVYECPVCMLPCSPEYRWM